MVTLKAGDKAPDFKLETSAGGEASLKDFRGKKVVLYFYPKDNTEGCTIEACEFGKANASFARKDAVVLGVSPDSLKKHSNFIRKFKLPFALLSDPDHQVCELYGAWGEKQMFGRKYMGVLRSTFLINEKGVLKKVWPKVSPEGHAADVLGEL